MPRYTIVLSDEFKKEWRKEIRYSKQHWGIPHAKQYFESMRSFYHNELSDTPQMHLKPYSGMPEGRGYIRRQGHAILFEVDAEKMQVRLLDIYGEHRQHQLREMMIGEADEES